ncbi:AAA family ATPase [Sorangium sp. So ce291]|uniref:AAA family ATPase n=1 Tax=Sorangium sp. So ce291 TaxID=3133294 RepID=UPI003F648B70
MPRLRHISVENYRAFERGLNLDLRPLTLIYGKNNAGKSSVVRLAGILHDSVMEGSKSPFELGGAAGGNASFVDVLNARARDDGKSFLELTLGWDDDIEASWRIGLHESGGMERVRVEQLLLKSGGTPAHYAAPKVLEAIPPEGATHIPELSFGGLVPLEAPTLPPAVSDLRARLLEIRGHVQYLSAVRAPSPKSVEPRGVAPDLSADGREAQEILLYDRAVRAEVETWLRTEVDRDLRRERMGDNSWRWLLPPRAAPTLSIPFASTGEGMTQVLPILVALAQRWGGARADGKRMFALEEPTTHLHDDLQIRLARHFASIAMAAEPPIILLETHARPLLLGVQRAILKEGLDPARVILYWVDQDETGASRAEPVEFDTNGLPTSSTLRSAFTDERRLLQELSRAHLRGPVPEAPKEEPPTR